MKKFLTITALLIGLGATSQSALLPKSKTIASTPAVTNEKFELDKSIIKNMCGIYKVSFDFAETFSADTGYKFYPRYKEWGIEYVFLAEETSDKISLQHLLIVNDSIIIKHWRQDWVYENTNVYKFYKDNEWIKETLTTEQAKGTWTQKVFQVDDSPRYESYGTWVHVDGKHFWEGVNDAPLPRREFSNRDDYNVMRRHSRMEVFNDGSWALIQDNDKVIRKNGVDKVLVSERGLEKFTKGSYDASPALKYWERQKHYWADVRKAWDDLYYTQPNLKLADRVDEMKLYSHLFNLGDKVCEKNYVKGSANEEIKKVIISFVKA
jgi:hypothetical protein